MTEASVPDFQVNILRNVGVAQAAYLAASSQKAKKACARNAEESAKCSRALLQLQIIGATAKIDLLDDLERLTDENKLFTIFDLLDKEGSGLADSRAIADGLLSIGGDASYVDNLTRAAKSIDMIDVDHDGKIKCSEFQRFLNILLNETGCTLHEVAELLVTHIVFPDISEAAPTAPSFEDRIDALFMIFDTNGDGNVDKKEVSSGFAKMMDKMDENTKIAWGALLLVPEEGNRILSFQEFVELLTNIAAAAKMEFNLFADTATLALCRTKGAATENLSYLFMGNELKAAMSEMEQMEKDTDGTIDPVQYGRMQRLFILWDLDRNGYIDLSEMLFGFRKFQDAKNISNTVEECVSAMLAFDTNDDAKLDMQEFAGFLVRFAKTSNVSVSELVDFMIVTSALKDNDMAEQDYIEAIGKKGTEAIMRRKGKRSIRSSILG